MSAPRRVRSIGGALVLSIVVIGLIVGAIALKSPLFEVRRVEVRGAGRLAPGDVSRLLPHVAGSNLLMVSLGDVERRILRDPWVAAVEARRRLPSTLVLHIEERVPVAWVRGPSGGLMLAADGTVLASGRHRGLVSLGRLTEEVAPGIRAPVREPLLRVIGALAPRVRRQVASAAVQKEGVVLRTRSGARVLFGAPEQLPAKEAALRALLRWMGEREVPAGIIDLRAPATPAIRPTDKP